MPPAPMKLSNLYLSIRKKSRAAKQQLLCLKSCQQALVHQTIDDRLDLLVLTPQMRFDEFKRKKPAAFNHSAKRRDGCRSIHERLPQTEMIKTRRSMILWFADGACHEDFENK